MAVYCLIPLGSDHRRNRVVGQGQLDQGEAEQPQKTRSHGLIKELCIEAGQVEVGQFF